MAQASPILPRAPSKQDVTRKPSFFRPWECSIDTSTEVPTTPQKSVLMPPLTGAVPPLTGAACTTSISSPTLARPTCTPSPVDSAYGGSTPSCSPATSPSSITGKPSPVGPNLEVLEQWYMRHMDLPYPSNKETKDLGRQCGLNFHQVRKWMSKRRSTTQIITPSANGKIYKDSSLQYGTPKKSFSSVMQKIRTKPSPYQLPAAVGGLSTIAARIPPALTGPPVPAVTTAASLHLQQAQQFYMYQQEQQTLHALYLQQLMAAQGLPLQHVQSLHTSD